MTLLGAGLVLRGAGLVLLGAGLVLLAQAGTARAGWYCSAAGRP